MGIFDSIKEKLLTKKSAEPAKTTTAAKISTPAPAAPAPAGKIVIPPPQAGTQAVAAAKAALAAQEAAEAAKKAKEEAQKAEPVDIEATIEAMVKAKGVTLNWRTSIVDLLKALDLDSSVAARKELANDLKYSGPHPDGSAEKNIWLHKEVMKALAANGGKVPAALLK